MKALNSVGNFDISKGTIQAWLYRIARNTVIDHYRTKKHADNIDDIWDLADSEDIARDIDTKDKLKGVEQYINKLKIEQRDIIIMRVWQEMSYKEIASIIGKSEASCKMMYSRAITKLRQDIPVSIFIWLALWI